VSPEILGLVMLGVMITLIMLGGHVAVVIGATGIIFAFIAGLPYLISLFPDRFYTVMTTFSLEAIPLFVFMGTILQQAGIAETIYNALRLVMGGVRGGLLLATTVFCIIFGACTGVLGAITVTMGLFALPAMIKARYSKELACGTICAGGCLGLIIPPSVVLILYGPCAGVSVAELFFASLTPGVCLGILYLIYIGVRCYLNPKLGPPMPIEERREVTVVAKLRLISTSILPAFFLISLVLGSILFGIASPTEAAAVGSCSALAIAAAYRKLTWQSLKGACWSATKIAAFILFITLGASVFTTVFMGLGSGDLVTNFLLGLQLGTLGTMVIVLGTIFIMGMFMDWIAILFIFVPLSIPIVNLLGLDPLWFGVLFCLALVTSFITPPFAMSAFYLKGIAPPGVTLGDIYRGVLPYIPIQLLGIVVVYNFPILCTWLPSLM